MAAITTLTNLVALLVTPLLLPGVINRTKSLWSGRKGPPLFQLAFDLRRLSLKRPVYSTSTSPIFRLAPYVFLVAALASGAIVPVLGGQPIGSFSFDFVWFFYVWALGRVAVMLAALDVGSSFEGMGAAREALFSSILEPASFLVIGALSFLSGQRSLYAILGAHPAGGAPFVVYLLAIAALLVVVQVEAARMPVDDPSTHLELTMVHEVMVLDHSGPDLAAIQLGAAIKLFVGCSLVASLASPWAGRPGLLTSVVHLGLCLVIAAVIGTIESVSARLKLRTVPQYIAIAVACGGVALLATIWRTGATR
ncbi:MAG TPA: NADH-quinone oxidoreductase subunit H [Polyangiaceae bacterium]|jgi:formate hydrogenlyase subunit 4|nr:NADH-quinone oxidoreductase subunit H [Polyangiaceae bacterium]